MISNSVKPPLLKKAEGAVTAASCASEILHEKQFIGAVQDEWQLYSGLASDYTIGLPIGFGASSIVYAAVYHSPSPSGPAIPIPCALKVLDLDSLPPRSLRLLQRETTLMSLSKHPNVLRVRGSWMDGHKLHIALRLMNKGSAADVMRYGWPGGMEEDVVRCILAQALKGLNYLHINGFIHRDVKAANLLIDDDGTVLLGDLGVAADLSEDTSPYRVPGGAQIDSQVLDNNDTKRTVAFDSSILKMSRPRMGKRKSFVGTPCWMAPELIQGRQYDSSADIWSFGITALELTQGRPPKSRETPQNILLRTIQDDPPSLDRQGGTFKYSRAFKEVVDSCLVKDPLKRPTAEELLQSPFFKAAKKKNYLVNAILKNLPPLTQRQERCVTSRSKTMQSVDSWDFATTVNLPTSNNRPRPLEEISAVPDDFVPDIFDMEEDSTLDNRHYMHSKGVSFAEKLGVSEIHDSMVPEPDAELASSPSSTNSAVSGKDVSLASSPLSLSTMPSSVDDAPSSDTHKNASSKPAHSPSSPGLWRKFKSNVKRSSSRNNFVDGGQHPAN